MKKTLLAFLAALLLAAYVPGLQAQNTKKAKPTQTKESTATLKEASKNVKGMPDLKKKVRQYATVPLKYDINQLEPPQRELVSIFIQISEIIDNIYWEQALDPQMHTKIMKMSNPALNEYVNINYGPWDRLDGNKPFVPGIGPKPEGANFYPQDMTKKEFEKLEDPQKASPYTVLQRGNDGNIKVIPYHVAYSKHLKRINTLLEKAIQVADNEEMRKYLEVRLKAILTDEYIESDLVWMDMKKSRLDFVFGPIETYEDALFGYKTAYEAFVLVKDEKWSDQLEHFTSMLPEMQKSLPCDAKYKKETPGTESDIYVYDVLYYAGNCNAGGKTIAINLPNDERVQLEKGTRRLQLKNAMQAKYDQILYPIAKQMINKEQLKNVTFDAFFSNVCFHEVAHGLGVKNVVKGKGTVREALKNQYSAWEEAKADICGLFLVQSLVEKGELKDVRVEDAYVTFLAGLLRSVRFGAAEAHGIANIMCFNYMKEQGAFSRNKEGKYIVDIKKMRTAIEGWAALVLKTEGDGNYETAKNYAEKNGKVGQELAKDLELLEKANIPVDVRFEQGAGILGLSEAPSVGPIPAKINNEQFGPLRKK